ncbi:hypothetical protein COS31_04715 [Candidatus Roizmanbacteria bacterium CG02_land_8_20_14_3_00_36_15]|uniref:GIY-YIG domain-containing protein n=2 Tax=Candidatus Roizmaniibacteriota TaxID=1752723 RepID=A0A2M8KKD2_9BACT|nr:MAG: hypothetical protein COS51_01985 [Candidatus Roizmanbacteria bacterium CG03_land_8_20_14_0_80_36_21]PIV37507.1 MAG: hypothetical protein COS31_04715 [Candidatus Roizmanbacteria bacterium CG02_land_8_20_14_3_00_36_15]PJA52664.1 MAG: hypothetical protein CO166_05055 [Candidatus Roizmanbacteria bacterium CG_4_9_14_3_um_filter_36_11]PJC81551.1 MAG: hypothetical protein CO007_04110 [Candidatus Roizmanbacteria bacterium CG_4_8_14_3_um_filter_36_10]PJE60379.1 MAG: hypothetical protein COU86_04
MLRKSLSDTSFEEKTLGLKRFWTGSITGNLGRGDRTPIIFLRISIQDKQIISGLDIIKTMEQRQHKYYVYTLLCLRDLEIYTGLTTDLKRRLFDHSRGLVDSPKIKIPFKLIYYEYFISLEDAKAREKFLKSNVGRAQLKDSLKKTLRDRRSMPYRMF